MWYCTRRGTESHKKDSAPKRIRTMKNESRTRNDVMFHFGVYQCLLLDDRDAGPRGPPEYVMKMDHPVDEDADEDEISVRVESDATDANKLSVSAKLGNFQGELDIRCSIDVWFGHTKVCSIREEKARVGANDWFKLCNVDLSGLGGTDEGRGGDIFRVFLNVVPESVIKKSRLPGLLAVQMFWFIAAQLIESALA